MKMMVIMKRKEGRKRKNNMEEKRLKRKYKYMMVINIEKKRGKTD